MTNEEMIKAWVMLDERMSRMEKTLSETLDFDKIKRRKTALDRLARRYRRLSAIGLAALGFPILYMVGDIVTGEWRIPVSVYMAVYFIICSIMDHDLYLRIKGIDIEEMTVEEVADKALGCRKRHHIYMMVLIPLAIVFLAMLAMAAENNGAILTGMVIGGVVGLAIGLRQYFNFMRDYREIKN